MKSLMNFFVTRTINKSSPNFSLFGRQSAFCIQIIWTPVMARGRPTLAFTPLLLLFLAVLQALGLTPIYQILEALDCPQLALYGMKEEFGIVSNHPKGVLIFEKDFDATKLDTQVCLVLDGGDFKGLVWSHEVKMVIWIRRDLLPSKFEVPMNIPLIIVEVSNKGESSVEEEIFPIVRTIIQ